MPIGDAEIGGTFLAVSHVGTSKAAGYEPGGLRRIQGVAQEFLLGEPVWPDAKVTGLWLRERLRRNARQHLADNITVFLNNVPRDAAATMNFPDLVIGAPVQSSPKLSQDAVKILERIVPPFALVQYNSQDSPVVAVTDSLGYYHLYWYQGDGWAAVSNSALALARCADVKMDEEALAHRSLLGFHLAESTPFRGINKLGPGGVCVLSVGKVHVGMYTDAAASLRRASVDRSLGDCAREVADLLRARMTRYVEEYPELLLQLSGGLDSRVELAAIPPKLRSGLRALTLSASGSRDADIAVSLANSANLEHQVLSLEPISDLDSVGAWQLVRQEAVRYNCSGDPIAHSVLRWAENQLGAGPRAHGAGGEIIRGFYYAGQQQRDTVNAIDVRRLAKWRLFSNDVIQAECLGRARADWAQEVTVSRLQEIFSGYDCDWLTATDMFYTFQRMSRWAGLNLTAASNERVLLSPLIDPRFVGAAFACSPRYKRGSRLMASILYQLDSELADVPLDSGHVPTRVMKASVSHRFHSLQQNARKIAKKIRQRISRSPRTSNEAEIIGRLVLSHWRSTPDLLNVVTRTSAINTEWLEQVLESRLTPDAATIGYLVNLQVISEQTLRT
jgi:asparagine synthase (glutamine-hydrolysing)